MLYEPINKPSKQIFLLCWLLVEKKWKIYLSMCFESLNFMALRNGIRQDKKFKSF